MRTERSVLTEEEIDEIREAFNLFDVENTGLIDPQELKNAMVNIGYDTKSPTVYNMLTNIQRLHPSKIDFETLVSAITSQLGDRDSKNGIRAIFSLFDDDKTGHISLKNLRRVAQELGEKFTDEELMEIINRADTTGKGAIDFEDFYSIMVKQNYDN